MGLVNKTYYSNTKNPQTHLFIHSIGSLSKSARSRNARHISDINTLNLVQNAKIVAYAFGTRFEFSKPIEVEGNPKIPDGEKEDLIDVEPESTDGHEWFTYFQNRSFKLSKEIIAFVEREKKRLSSKTLREDSIGKYVAERGHNLSPILLHRSYQLVSRKLFRVVIEGFQQSFNNFVFQEVAIMVFEEDSIPTVYHLKPPTLWEDLSEEDEYSSRLVIEMW